MKLAIWAVMALYLGLLAACAVAAWVEGSPVLAVGLGAMLVYETVRLARRR